MDSTTAQGATKTRTKTEQRDPTKQQGNKRRQSQTAKPNAPENLQETPKKQPWGSAPKKAQHTQQIKLCPKGSRQVPEIPTN
eukprot:8958667-Pyramimonas_sp.AAC.3